jgi:hypothetical protein
MRSGSQAKTKFREFGCRLFTQIFDFIIEEKMP